jgi:aminopeptidase O
MASSSIKIILVLSQGFATFLEDPLHSRTMEIIRAKRPDFKVFLGCRLDEPPDWREVSELRSLIRYRTVKAELENTEPELQSLRPMRGNELRDGETDALYVKNGINPEIAFTQVHYIKGYFLLRYEHANLTLDSSCQKR